MDKVQPDQYALDGLAQQWKWNVYLREPQSRVVSSTQVLLDEYARRWYEEYVGDPFPHLPGGRTPPIEGCTPPAETLVSADESPSGSYRVSRCSQRGPRRVAPALLLNLQKPHHFFQLPIQREGCDKVCDTLDAERAVLACWWCGRRSAKWLIWRGETGPTYGAV
jgi:hypothetical protein